MKTIFAIIWFFLPALAVAQVSTMNGVAASNTTSVNGVAVAGISSVNGVSWPSSGSLLFDSTVGSVNAWSFGDSSGTMYAGQEDFSDTSSHTITKITWKLSQTGDISTKTFTCQIYLDAAGSGGGGALGSLVTNGTSNGVVGPSLATPWSSASGTLVDFVFPIPPTISANTKVHIVISQSGGADNVNHGYAHHTGGTNLIPGELDYFHSDGTNQYPTTFPSYDLQMKIWGT